jgi:prevent-host-death family protein
VPDVTVRDLRNHGGDVLDRVVHGETVTITRGGRPVAELRPLPSPGLSTRVLIERWSRLPAMDPTRLRQDLETVFDARV